MHFLLRLQFCAVSEYSLCVSTCISFRKDPPSDTYRRFSLQDVAPEDYNGREAESTCIMLRNLPNRFTPQQILNVIFINEFILRDPCLRDLLDLENSPSLVAFDQLGDYEVVDEPDGLEGNDSVSNGCNTAEDMKSPEIDPEIPEIQDGQDQASGVVEQDQEPTTTRTQNNMADDIDLEDCQVSLKSSSKGSLDGDDRDERTSIASPPANAENCAGILPLSAASANDASTCINSSLVLDETSGARTLSGARTVNDDVGVVGLQAGRAGSIIVEHCRNESLGIGSEDNEHEEGNSAKAVLEFNSELGRDGVVKSELASNPDVESNLNFGRVRIVPRDCSCGSGNNLNSALSEGADRGNSIASVDDSNRLKPCTQEQHRQGFLALRERHLLLMRTFSWDDMWRANPHSRMYNTIVGNPAGNLFFLFRIYFSLSNICITLILSISFFNLCSFPLGGKGFIYFFPNAGGYKPISFPSTHIRISILHLLRYRVNRTVVEWLSHEIASSSGGRIGSTCRTICRLFLFSAQCIRYQHGLWFHPVPISSRRPALATYHARNALSGKFQKETSGAARHWRHRS